MKSLFRYIPIAFAALLVFAAPAFASAPSDSPACENTPESVAAGLSEREWSVVVLSEARLEAFDEAVQSVGGPAMPEEITHMVMIDPREHPQRGVRIAVFHDGCFTGLITWPAKITVMALRAAESAVRDS